jgi:hypothetical protein
MSGKRGLFVVLAGSLTMVRPISVTVTQTGSTLFSPAALPRFFCGWIAGSFTLV